MMNDGEAKSLAHQIQTYGRDAMDPEVVQRLDELKTLVRTEPERKELYYELLSRSLLLVEILMTAETAGDTRRLAILGTFMRLSDLMLRKAPDDDPRGSESARVIDDIRTRLESDVDEQTESA